MKEPGLPPDEAERLAALERYEVLDTLPEHVYDDIVALAAHICGVPIALVSLVDGERQWFKARFGLDATETPRGLSFCAHVVESGSAMVVGDAVVDERFADNPLVTGEPRVRFYAGAPLSTPDGHTLGTLCVIDHQPRELGAEQRAMLNSLSRLVVDQLELRIQGRARAQAETDAGMARDQQRRFFELSLDMLCVAGFDGYFKALNPAWSRVLGFSEAELLAAPFIDFVHPDDRERTMSEAAALAARERNTVSFENRYRTAVGDYRWLLWTAAFDPENELLLAAARDITERKQSEHLLAEARDEAESANRAKSAFLANMSHELRTPLNSVIGFTNLLLKNKAGNLRSQDIVYLERIATNGTHLLGLISDVLDLSKVEARETQLEIKPVDLWSLIHEVAEQLQGNVEQTGNVLQLEVPADLAKLPADRKRLKQVLINLLGNAAKFTEDGVVELRVVADDGDPPRPIRIDVADTGIGISEGEQAIVFEIFRQVDDGEARRFSGSGLGLAISQTICEEHGFGLEVASRRGEGSTFSVRLSGSAPPLVHRPPQRSPSKSQPIPTMPFIARAPIVGADGKVVLIIDDDSDARLILSKLVEEVGARVVTADSGGRGLQIAAAVEPAVIVLDLSMPGMSGDEVMVELAGDEKLRHIPVVICSTATPRRRELIGAVALFDKPVDRSEFLETIRPILSGADNILVVDDEPDSTLILEAIVGEVGASSVTASNGREALERLDDLRPDLIVLDLRMPEMDGFEFLHRLRSKPEFRTVPVVICTAHEIDSEQEAFLRYSAQSIVRKGDSLEHELIGVLGRLLQGAEDEANRDR